MDLVGTEVLLTGLKSRPDLNGRTARAVACDCCGRVSVVLAGEGDTLPVPLCVKRKNLAAARTSWVYEAYRRAENPRQRYGSLVRLDIAAQSMQAVWRGNRARCMCASECARCNKQAPRGRA